jgi:hypothetical protein
MALISSTNLSPMAEGVSLVSCRIMHTATVSPTQSTAIGSSAAPPSPPEDAIKEEDDDDNGITRCLCDESGALIGSYSQAQSGYTYAWQYTTHTIHFVSPEAETKDMGFMVQCEKCDVWQHGICMGIAREEDCPEKYFCDECRPDLHKKVLEYVKFLLSPWTIWRPLSLLSYPSSCALFPLLLHDPRRRIVMHSNAS